VTAIIYKKEKNAMQSGKHKTDIWFFEYERESRQDNQPLMGWVKENDTKQEVSLSFSSKEDAVEYAERENIAYKVIEPKEAKIKLQAYADNFM